MPEPKAPRGRARVVLRHQAPALANPPGPEPEPPNPKLRRLASSDPEAIRARRAGKPRVKLGTPRAG